MRKEDDKIALFEMLERQGELGFHIMYICIKNDGENPLGHGSAVKRLEECGERNFQECTSDCFIVTFKSGNFKFC